MDKRSVEISLNTAKSWFKKGGGLRELALTAYTREELDENKTVWDYEGILKKFTEKYPIGSVVWSNDGNDYYPNIIVSEPYLRNSENSFLYNIKKVIIFNTKRIGLTEVLDGKIRIRSKDEFENIQIHSYFHPDGFDYKKWKNDYIKRCNERNIRNSECIENYKKQIEELQTEIDTNEYKVNHFDELYRECIENLTL